MSIPGSKQEFFNEICRRPLDVNREKVFYWCNVQNEDQVTFPELRQLLLRIFDQNEKSLQEASDATVGPIGRFNKKSTRKRNNFFRKKINRGCRNGVNKIVVAEGDSWFQFPFYIDDIIDHLIYNDDILVYSMAYGGDWLANILYEGKYIEEISKIIPDAFLVSGGGNDLVGAGRVAVMVDQHPGYRPKYKDEQEIIELNRHIHKGDASLLQHYNPQMILAAQPYIRKEFYSFMWVLYMQYYLLFTSIQQSASFKNMLVLTQGYDYAIPHLELRFDFRYMLQPLINYVTGSSRWLFTPLMLKGFRGKTLRDSLIHTFIFEFNLIFMDLVQLPDFPNVFHIDCRGVASLHDSWFDELHLKSHEYKRIAEVYADCIRQFGKPPAPEIKNILAKKIIRVTDYY